jgi:hypothetical protein
VAKSIKLQVHYLRWLAKINYEPEEYYGPRELTEISKVMTTVPGIQCAWVHPQIDNRLLDFNLFPASFHNFLRKYSVFVKKNNVVIIFCTNGRNLKLKYPKGPFGINVDRFQNKIKVFQDIEL